MLPIVTGSTLAGGRRLARGPLLFTAMLSSEELHAMVSAALVAPEIRASGAMPHPAPAEKACRVAAGPRNPAHVAAGRQPLSDSPSRAFARPITWASRNGPCGAHGREHRPPACIPSSRTTGSAVDPTPRDRRARGSAACHRPYVGRPWGF